MNKFIYVFTQEDKNKLLSSGYHLLQEMQNKNTYVFENKLDTTFDLLDESKYMKTNILMF